MMTSSGCRLSNYRAALMLLLGSLSGCAETQATYVPLAITSEKAPIVAECNPRGRARIGRIEKIPGNKTPLSHLETAMVEAGRVDLINEIRETACFCAQLDERGSEAEKAQSKTLCSTVRPKAQSTVKSAGTYAGS